MQTLTVAGKPVQFTVRQTLCMPPHVSVPKPGPCPGAKRGLKKVAETVKKGLEDKPAKKAEKATTARKKAVAKATSKTSKAKGAAGRVAGRDVREEIDYDKLESLFAPTHRNPDDNDLRLAEVARIQGFDGKPRLASKTGVDAIVRAGGLELFRGTKDSDDGITGAEYARRFREDDKAVYRQGRFGNGIYTTPSARLGALYSEQHPGGVNRMVVDPDARIVGLRDLEKQMRDDTPPELWHKREEDQRKLMDLIRDASTESEMEAAFQAFNREGSRGKAKNLLTTDSSLYAMSKGYDVVKVELSDGEPYFIVLNRTAVTVEDPSSSGGGDRDLSPGPAPESAAPPAPKKRAVAKKTAVPKTPKPAPTPEPAKAPEPTKTASKTASRAASKTTGKTYPPPPSPQAQAARDHADELIKTGRVPSHMREDVREGLYAMADQSPQAMRALKGVGIGAGEPGEKIDPEGMFQYMPRARTIAISSRFSTKAGRDAYERDVASSMKDGYLAPSGLSPLAGSMVHEYGHHMAFRRYTPGQAGMSRDVAVPVLAAIARQIGVAPPKIRPQGSVLYAQEIGPWWRANRRAIFQKIGEYAADSIHEAIAEGWQEGSTMGTKARPYARDIVRVLNR